MDMVLDIDMAIATDTGIGIHWTPKSWNMDVGLLVLVLHRSLVRGWRTVMFQLSGFYCIDIKIYRCKQTVDFKQLEHRRGSISAGCPSSVGFGVTGRSCSNLLASTVHKPGPTFVLQKGEPC